MNLYEITGAMAELQAMEDIDPETLADTLEGLEMEFEVKLSNLARWVRDLEGDSEKLSNELKRLATKRQSVDKRVESLKEYVRQALLSSGRTKVGDGVHTWRVQQNPPKVVVEAGADIPLCYYVEKVDRQVDKGAIKQALQAGHTVPGCSLISEAGIRLK